MLNKFHNFNVLIYTFYHFFSYLFPCQFQLHLISYNNISNFHYLNLCNTQLKLALDSLVLLLVVVHSLSRVGLFATPWTAACQASLSLTISQSLLRLMSIESVMPSNHLILCRSLHLLPSIFPSIRVFSNELALCIRWPKYWSFSLASVLPANIQD